jgi:endogenous inhibitor of DNA gyrase (YacG/DUF329 family)
MKCPVCKKDAEPNNPEFPFCSERCRTIDLGNWSAEKYVISEPAKPQEQSEDEDD